MCTVDSQLVTNHDLSRLLFHYFNNYALFSRLLSFTFASMWSLFYQIIQLNFFSAHFLNWTQLEAKKSVVEWSQKKTQRGLPSFTVLNHYNLSMKKNCKNYRLFNWGDFYGGIVAFFISFSFNLTSLTGYRKMHLCIQTSLFCTSVINFIQWKTSFYEKHKKKWWIQWWNIFLSDASNVYLANGYRVSTRW